MNTGDANALNGNAAGATSKERLAKLQLDMQTDLCRELESRLEQSLTGWKLEKQNAKEYSCRLVDMKATALESSKIIQGLRDENKKLKNRLGLYDTLPLPVRYESLLILNQT